MEAVKAYATTDEIIGTIRECFGYTYDPFEMEKSAFPKGVVRDGK